MSFPVVAFYVGLLAPLQAPPSDSTIVPWPAGINELGHHVASVLVTGENVVGTPMRITPDELIVEHGGRTTSVRRVDACQMTVVPSSHRAGWIGVLGVGGGYGGLAYGAGGAENGRQGTIAAYAAVGAASGAVLGYLIARANERPAVVVFRSGDPRCASVR